MTAHKDIFQGVHIHCMESCAADCDAFMCRKKPGPLGDAHPKLPPRVNVASVRSACETYKHRCGFTTFRKSKSISSPNLIHQTRQPLLHFL